MVPSREFADTGDAGVTASGKGLSSSLTKSREAKVVRSVGVLGRPEAKGSLSMLLKSPTVSQELYSRNSVGEFRRTFKRLT
jgi:hypothetical protein